MIADEVAPDATTLDPAFSAKVAAIVTEMAKRGYDVRVVSTTRTAARQKELFSQGRSKPGNVVTEKSGAPGDESLHQSGLAADFTFKGKANWALFGQVAKQQGLEWGGDWQTLRDYGHVQGSRPSGPVAPHRVYALDSTTLPEVAPELPSSYSRMASDQPPVTVTSSAATAPSPSYPLVSTTFPEIGQLAAMMSRVLPAAPSTPELPPPSPSPPVVATPAPIASRAPATPAPIASRAPATPVPAPPMAAGSSHPTSPPLDSTTYPEVGMLPSGNTHLLPPPTAAPPEDANPPDAGGQGTPAAGWDESGLPPGLVATGGPGPAPSPVPQSPGRDAAIERLQSLMQPRPENRFAQLMRAVIPMLAALGNRDSFGAAPLLHGYGAVNDQQVKQQDVEAQRQERLALAIKALENEKIAQQHAAAAEAKAAKTEQDRQIREDYGVLNTYFKDPNTKAAIAEMEKQNPEGLAGMAIKMPDGRSMPLTEALDRIFVKDSGSGLHVGLHEDVVAKPGTEEEFMLRQRGMAQKVKAEKTGDSKAALSPEELNKVDLAARQTWAASSKDAELQKLILQDKQFQTRLLEIQLEDRPTKDDFKYYGELLLAHRIAPSQMTLFAGFSKDGRLLAREAIKYATSHDPDFNTEEAESTYQLVRQGSYQQVVRLVENSENTLPRIEAAVNGLKNTDLRLWNSLKNATKEQLNSPAVSRYNAARLATADEIAKILQGGGTGSATSDAKLQQAQALFRNSDSPAAIAAAIDEVHEMLKLRRQALTYGTIWQSKRMTGAAATIQGGSGADPGGLGPPPTRR